MKLNEMGLIFNDSLITLRFQITTEPGLVFVNGDLGMTLATKGEESLDVGIQQYPFTQAGKELATLVVNCPSDEDFIEFRKNIAKFNNYKVGIHKIIEIDGENFEYDDINILED